MFHKVFIAIILASIDCFGFVPRASLILQKTAENNGSGTYIIEQEVQFPTDSEPVVLREIWTVENENSMKLSVSGTKELKDQLKMQFIYLGGQRTSFANSSKQTRKISEDFIEKYFHVRSGEAYANNLIQMRILPGSVQIKKQARTSKDFEYTPEPFVRLSRVGGTVSYALGTPSAPETKENSAGFWIEQDQFVLRKFRLPSGVETSAERYSQYPRGMSYPRKRSIRWDNNAVQIQTLSVVARPTSGIGNAPLEPTHTEGLESLPNKNVILDFYNRLR